MGNLGNKSNNKEISQILEKKWENNEAVHQPFIDFKKEYVSFWREVLYNILSLV
jgi:hypothetical protein